MESELTRERGLWGPEQKSVLDKYQLDTTEGILRIRKKLVPNTQFFIDHPYRPQLEPANAVNVRKAI